MPSVSETFETDNLQLVILPTASAASAASDHDALVEIFEVPENCAQIAEPEELDHEDISYGFVTRATGCGPSDRQALLMFGLAADEGESYMLVVVGEPGRSWTVDTALDQLTID